MPQGVYATTTAANTHNWAHLQSTDPDTSITYSRQLHGQHKPSQQEMEGYSWAAQTIAALWGRLRLQDDVLYFRYDDQSPLRLVILPSAAAAFAKELHTELGHAGQTKTGKAARQRFWWPDMKRDAFTVCNS